MRTDEDRVIDAVRLWLGVAMTAESEVEAVDAFLAARKACRELHRHRFPHSEEDQIQRAQVDLDRELARTAAGRRPRALLSAGLAAGSCIPVPIEPESEFAGPHETRPQAVPVHVPAQGYLVPTWEDR